MFDLANTRIGIVGLGYVGLPLAVEFGKQFPTIGLDINADRIRELQVGRQHAGSHIRGTTASQPSALYRSHRDLAACNVYIVTVPTPVDSYKRPDFSPLIGASTTVGRLLKPGDVAIYESTVYPGATEEICVPILERESGLRFNADFSPAIARNASTPVTRITGLPAFSRSLPAPHRKRRRSWTHCTGASLPPELTAPPASAWRKPPR